MSSNYLATLSSGTKTRSEHSRFEIRQLAAQRPRVLRHVKGEPDQIRKKLDGTSSHKFTLDDLVGVLMDAVEVGDKETGNGAQYACWLLNGVILDAGLAHRVVAIPTESGGVVPPKPPELELLDVAVAEAKYVAHYQERAVDGWTLSEIQAQKRDGSLLIREVNESIASIETAVCQ